MTTTKTTTVPEQMQLAAQRSPALVAKLEAHEDWVVKNFGIPIDYHYAPQWQYLPAWLTESAQHQLLFSEGELLDSFLWEWSFMLTALTLQGQAIQARGWLPYFSELPFDKVLELHCKHGFLPVAKSLCSQGHDLGDVIGNQFSLINEIPEILGRTIIHMGVEVRMARDFPEINGYFSPLRKMDWEPVAISRFSKLIAQQLPPKIARGWWSVKTALAILTDRLTGTRFEDLFGGLGESNLALAIADYCQGSLEQMQPGGEYEIIRHVSHMAGLQDFQNAQKIRNWVTCACTGF